MQVSVVRTSGRCFPREEWNSDEILVFISMLMIIYRMIYGLSFITMFVVTSGMIRQ